MKSRLIITICLLLSCVWVLSLFFQRPLVQARAPSPPPEKKPVLVERTKAEEPTDQICSRWDFRLISGKDLSPLLEEMSGIAFSSHWKDILYHVADSGNDPLLVLTSPEGGLQDTKPYADRASDSEELSVGPCPWSRESSCVYVADTGDNFGLRSERQVHVVDEASLQSPNPRRETWSFRFPGDERLDVEAMAVDPKTGSILLFSKEKKKSRVYALEAPTQGSAPRARFLAELPFSRVTGAAFHPAGQRLILLNVQGAFELSASARAGFDREARSWFPFQRKIVIPPLVQSEAITYSPSGLSFAYSSERKKWSKKPWGLMRARCLEPLDPSFP